MISEQSGWGWFIKSIFILSIGTYILAFYIQDILNCFSFLFTFFKYEPDKGDKAAELTGPNIDDDDKPPLNLWRWMAERREKKKKDDEEKGKGLKEE